MPFFGNRYCSFCKLFFISLLTLWKEKSKKIININNIIFPNRKKNKNKKKTILFFICGRLKEFSINLITASKLSLEKRLILKKEKISNFIFWKNFCPQKKETFWTKKPCLDKPNSWNFVVFYQSFLVLSKETKTYNERFFSRKLDFLFFLSRTKHKGINYKNWEKFVVVNKNVSLISKRLFSKNFLESIRQRGLIRRQKWGCPLSTKRCVNYALLNHPSFYATRFCFDSKETIFPPCINCPVLSECHPQTSLSPFDCFHFHFWIKV